MGRRTPRRTVLTGVNGFRFEIELDQIGDNRPRAHVGRAFVALQKMKTSDRRLRDATSASGHFADIAARSSHLRFTPESRHWDSATKCPLRVKIGHTEAARGHPLDYWDVHSVPNGRHRVVYACRRGI